MNSVVILRTLSLCIYIYIFLLIIRVLCIWFKPQVDGKLWNYLCLITGHYLALFKGIKFLKRGIFDFTPVLAISLLVFCNQITEEIIKRLIQINEFSFWVFLSIIVTSLWHSIMYIIIFFGILCIIRLISIVFQINKSNNILNVIDLAIQPVISFIMKIIPRKLEYVQLLFLNFLFFVAILLLGEFIFSYLAELLSSIPV